MNYYELQRNNKKKEAPEIAAAHGASRWSSPHHATHQHGTSQAAALPRDSPWGGLKECLESPQGLVKESYET